MIEHVGWEDFMGVFSRVGLRVYPEQGNFAYAPTGELYWLVTSGGVVPDGTGKLMFFSTKNTALRQFNQVVRKRLDETWGECEAKERFTVYFREYPRFIERQTGFCVVSRFLISCKRVIFPADLNQIQGVNRGDRSQTG